MEFHCFKIEDIISIRKLIVDMGVVNVVTCTHQNVITCGLSVFMTRRYALNNTEVI